MNWIVNQIVKLLIDVLVKIILKWIADREAERSTGQAKPVGEVEAPKKPSEARPPAENGGWNDKGKIF